MTYAGRSLWVSDEAADLIWEYVRALRDTDRSEIVTIPALDTETRAPIAVTLVLSSTVPLLVEGTDAEGGHRQGLDELRQRIAGLHTPGPRQPSEVWPLECDTEGTFGHSI